MIEGIGSHYVGRREGVDSELPIKVGIKPYHHGKVIDNR